MTKKLIIAIVAGIVFPLYAIAGQPSAQITNGPYRHEKPMPHKTVYIVSTRCTG